MLKQQLPPMEFVKPKISYTAIKPEFANYVEVIDEVRRRFIEAGLKIVEEGYVIYDRAAAEEHYEEHKNKNFFNDLVDYLTSDKSYAMIVEGEDPITTIRYLVCRDKSVGIQSGDIRYDIPVVLGMPHRMTENVIHASDSLASAEREIAIYKKLKAKEADKNATGKQPGADE